MKKLQLLLILAMPMYLFGQGTFTQTHNLGCGDSINLGPLGYPFWNPPQIVQQAQFGTATTDSLNIMNYQAIPFFEGSDTVVVACAQATQITCDTGIYIFKVSCANPADEFFTYDVFCDDTLCVYNMSGFGAPNIIVEPTQGSATIFIGATDGAGICYIPNDGFEGTDVVLVKHFNILRLYIFKVNCSPSKVVESPLSLVPVSPNPSTGRIFIATTKKPEYVVLTNASGSFQSIDFEDNGDQIEMDLTRFPPGVYWVRLQYREGAAMAKVVIY